MAKKKSSSGSSKKTDRIDFGGVPEERRQRGRRIPEGEYVAKIVSHKKKWKDDDKSNAPYYSWLIQVIESAEGKKKYAGVPFYENTSLKPDALFNLRNLIFAATDGKKNVAGRKVDFDPKSLYGKKICIIVEDEEYDNKMRSKIADVRPLSEMSESDEDDEDTDDDEDEDDDSEDEDEDEDEEDDDEDDEDEEDDDDLDEVDTDDI